MPSGMHLKNEVGDLSIEVVAFTGHKGFASLDLKMDGPWPNFVVLLVYQN